MSGARRFRITSTVVIPFEELEWRVDTSGGPGGQHANVTRSRVEVRFDIAASRGLGERAKARLLERLGPVVRAGAGDARSQSRNRSSPSNDSASGWLTRCAWTDPVDRPHRLPRRADGGSTTKSVAARSSAIVGLPAPTSTELASGDVQPYRRTVGAAREARVVATAVPVR